ncbi:MAG: 3-hydroxyacyl-CoA dehydrogenase NAD-binding domain-containing protein [Pseudoxanthomonas sp.]
MSEQQNTIDVSVDADGIATLTIDLPGKPLNVITPELQRDLATAVEKVANDADIKGAILISGKPGAFIAGADIKDLVLAFDAGVSAAQGAELSQSLSRVLRRLETSGKPFVAAINGLALGGGFEIALACHHRVIADNAAVGLPESGIGLLPGGGGTQRLPRLVGIEKAGPLLLTGRQLKADEAVKLGVVDEAVAPDTVLVAARAWLLESPSSTQPWDVKGYQVPGGAGPLAPHAQRTFTAGTAVTARDTQRNLPAALAILSCLYEGTQVPIDTGLKIESKYFGQLLADPVARNMMRTLFINKGAADKLVRRPPGMPASKAKKIGVIGAGMMGAGIAYVAATAGIEVVLLDSTQEKAEHGKQYSVDLLEKAIARGRNTREKADALLARICPTSEYADLAGVGLVVEAVFENREVKADVTRRAAAVIGDNVVFASNTSTLPITSLAETFVRPEDFIGLHFFSPVDRMPLVEVILGKNTGEATLARALDFVAQLRKTPILVNDGPGFFTSRVFATYFQEGILMLEEGVAPALIENAAKLAGFPIGPLAVSDEVTLELQLKIIEQSLADGQAETPNLSRVLAVLRHLVGDLKRVGRRGGGGFYDYPADAPKRLWTGLAQEYALQPQQPDVQEVKQRLLCIQAIEAARAVEQGIVVHAADADLGSILGIGFPVWTGGVLSFIDTIGLPAFVAESERLAQAHGPRFAPSEWLRAKAARGEFFHPPLASAA